MPLNWANQLKRFYRTPAEFKEIGTPRDRLIKGLTFAIPTFALLAYTIAEFGFQADQWQHLSQPNVPISSVSWRVLYGEQVSGALPTDDLWKKAIARDSQEHATRRMREGRDTYWLQARVDHTLLEKASQEHAYTLVLGWFRGSYEAWLNGKPAGTSEGRIALPLVITVHEGELSSPELQITVRVEKLPDHQFGDLMNIGTDTGFYDARNLDSYFGFHGFWARTRPIAFLAINALIALFFFAVWIHFPIKAEYFYLALFSLSSAFVQLRNIDFVFLSLSWAGLFRLSFLASCGTALSGFLLGMALARVRRKVIGAFALFPPIILVAIALFADNTGIRTWDRIAVHVFNPLGLAFGGLACLSQTLYLLKRFGPKSASKSRMRTLAFASIGLLAMAWLYYYRSNLSLFAFKTHYWMISHTSANLLVLLYMSFVMLQELRQQTLLVEKTPVSEYHRRPVLPDVLSGTLLTIDMKNSESLFRISTTDTSGENWVGVWRSHAYLAIARYEGTVLQKKGDEIQIFFDADKSPSSEGTAFAAFAELVRVSRALEASIPVHDVVHSGTLRFRIRGSLASGHIKPIWEKMGRGIEEPYWEQAQGSQAFVEAARLLDAEKQLVNSKTIDALAMEEKIYQKVRGATVQGTWVSRMGVRVKDSPEMHTWAFLPDAGKLEATMNKTERKVG